MEEVTIPVASLFLTTTRSTTLKPNLVHDSADGSSSQTAITLRTSPTAVMQRNSQDIPVHGQPGTNITGHQLGTISAGTPENINQQPLLNFSAINDGIMMMTQDSADMNSPNSGLMAKKNTVISNVGDTD